MNVHETMKAALRTLPCPSGHAPLGSRPDTYVSWFEVLAETVLDASNRPLRLRHMLQVDIYSKAPTEALLETLLRLLKAGGFKIASYGPEDYEEDTRYRHMPVTVRIDTKMEEE